MHGGREGYIPLLHQGALLGGEAERLPTHPGYTILLTVMPQYCLPDVQDLAQHASTSTYRTDSWCNLDFPSVIFLRRNVTFCHSAEKCQEVTALYHVSSTKCRTGSSDAPRDAGKCNTAVRECPCCTVLHVTVCTALVHVSQHSLTFLTERCRSCGSEVHIKKRAEKQDFSTFDRMLTTRAETPCKTVKSCSFTPF